MPMLLTWLRECDQTDFERFFKTRHDLQVQNARLQSCVAPSQADGLLLSGGPDISEQFLQQPVADSSVIHDPDPVRDAWELQMAKAFLEAGKPVLAICKGMQVLNVALGGTLHLDILGHNRPEDKRRNVQPLRYAQAAECRFERVNSSHHQALDRLGEGLEVEAWHVGDSVIEQVRLKGHPFVVGVQYHPERDLLYAPLFNAFFNQLEHGR